MRKPHFFKVRSRIGIIGKPNGQKEDNVGVEDGADYILEDKFLLNFSSFSLSSFEFPAPESINSKFFYSEVSKHINDLQKLINKNFKKDEIQVVIGGDHSVTLSSVLALISRVKNTKKIGYIHFDSHGDINLHKETPSKNFHGMYLRPLFDVFDILEIDKLVPIKIPTENALFIGNLDLDKGEIKFFKDKNIKSISRDELLKNRNRAIKGLKSFIQRYDYLHVSFDGDVFDRTIFPATGIPAKNGFMLSEIMTLIRIISNHPKLTFDIAEFNPRKKGAVQSKEIAQKILLSVLK